MAFNLRQPALRGKASRCGDRPVCAEWERAAIPRIQIKADNGPESSGRRTQFLKRMVDFADATGR